MSTTVKGTDVGQAGELPEGVREAVRDLILVLADSKRLLGMRYGQWMLGAPELEAGIACASMAQDEWGHGRLLYALLRDFGEDMEGVEHGREPHQYSSMEVLDAEPGSWPEVVALNALADTALTVQLEALAGAAYLPLRQRVQKLVEEETFHEAHGVAWVRRLAASGAGGEMTRAVEVVLPGVLRWFGGDEGPAKQLQDAGITDATGGRLRERFLERVSPVLEAAGVEGGGPELSGFDEKRRRGSGSAPDARTIEQVRGDRNRAFLME
jgi:ring-1,2-phenylacetyl-CoA epoxidase subunit PaaC